MPAVLVVDDDTTNSQLIAMLLELDGYQVTTTTNVADAISLTTGQTTAFVIDWYLERNSSGLELLEAIRDGKTEAAPDALIVITSGDQRKQEASLRAGANLFMLKPYPPDELSRVLQAHVSGSTN